jgi:glycosyltransferase involved in cell wall biosynthesis
VIHIAFAWPGLPNYAARQIAALIRMGTVRVTVIGTRPSVPIAGMEDALGQAIHWIEPQDSSASWKMLALDIPDLLFVGGWITPSFDRLAAQCREQGSPVVLMCDTCWEGGLRHSILDPIRHRLKFKRRYAAAFVPGQSGERYVRSLGYPATHIRQGLYGVDASLFALGPPMAERPKVITFVGQFVARKNVISLTRAFVRFADNHPEWTLKLIGAGAQKDELARHANILVQDFVQPPEVAKLLQMSRVLVLPSLSEHWALVIHEAALSGCALALSDINGSIPELAGTENSVTFPARSEQAIEDAFRTLASWDERQWETARLISHRKASNFGPERFAQTALSFADLFNRVKN